MTRDSTVMCQLVPSSQSTLCPAWPPCLRPLPQNLSPLPPCPTCKICAFGQPPDFMTVLSFFLSPLSVVGVQTCCSSLLVNHHFPGYFCSTLCGYVQKTKMAAVLLRSRCTGDWPGRWRRQSLYSDIRTVLPRTLTTRNMLLKCWYAVLSQVHSFDLHVADDKEDGRDLSWGHPPWSVLSTPEYREQGRNPES